MGASLGHSSEKPATVIILPLPEIKNLRLNWKMHAHHFLRLERHHSPVVCAQR